MKIIVAALLRNEASRFLESALRVWADFADTLVVVDDGSTDKTRAICARAGAHIYTSETDTAWGKEAPARAQLWERAVSHASSGDFVFVLDGDMVPVRDPRPLFETTNADAIAFPLYDLWHADGERLYYRVDNAWGLGPKSPRIWAARAHPEPFDGWQWPKRGVHCGHFPINLVTPTVAFAPRDHGLLHFAYVTPQLREAKAAQYDSVSKQLSPFEAAHAASILEPARLELLPFTPDYTL